MREEVAWFVEVADLGTSPWFWEHCVNDSVVRQGCAKEGFKCVYDKSREDILELIANQHCKEKESP